MEVEKKETLKTRLDDKVLKAGVYSTLAVGSVSNAFAYAPDVTEVVADIAEAKTPIASVAGASLGAYVAIRVWKLVRRAI